MFPGKVYSSRTGYHSKLTAWAGRGFMPITVEELLGQIERNHLMSTKDQEAVKARWFRPGRKEADDATRFCDWLRVNNYLSEFVATPPTRSRADRLALNQHPLSDLM